MEASFRISSSSALTMGPRYRVILCLSTIGHVFGKQTPLSAQSGLMDDLRFHHQTNLDAQCQLDLQQLVGKIFGPTNAFDKPRNRAYDATGKLPAGVLVGNWAALGHFDECQAITGFKYCLADFYISINGTEHLQLLSSLFRWGLCISQSCSEDDVSTKLTDLFGNLPLENTAELKQVLVNCAHEPVQHYDTGFYCTVSLCCILATLIITSGLYDEYTKFRIRCKTSRQTEGVREDEAVLMKEESAPLRPRENNKQQCFLGRLFLCFAISRNIGKLLSTTQPKKNIKCLNGIRIFSMFWVIFGHTSSYLFTSLIVDNPSRAWDAAGGFLMQTAANAFVAVDSFFFLSGLLVSYLTLQKLERTGGSLPLFSFYLHRILRILPSYMFVILLFIFIVPYLSQGPIWFARLQDDSCQLYWWTNMLFINNFYPISFLKQCMDWSWYLANDMQFYIISPLLLLVIHRSRLIGISLISILCGTSIVTTSVLMGINGFPNGFQGFMERRSRGEDYLSVVYDKPYCRITPYLIGLLLGYGMSRLKATNQIVKLSSVVVVVGWVFAVILMILVVFGLYPSYHGDPTTVVANSMYEGLSRFTWSVALSWVVFACFYGYGGWVNQFLSCGLWVPLSRLVFNAYLLHPIFIMVFIFSTFEPLHYSYTQMVYYYLAYVLAAFSVAALIYVLVELPFANIIELFNTRTHQKHNPEKEGPSNPKIKESDECV